MRMSPDNGYYGFQVLDDTDGSQISHVAWVDDTTQEMACYEWPYRFVGYELAVVVRQINGVCVDLVKKEIHVNTGVVLTLQSKAQPVQPQACDACTQEETCRRINYCAAYRCTFGEVKKP